MSALLAEFPSPLTDKESFLLSSRYLSFSSFYWNVMWSCFIIPAECHKLHACWTDWRWRRVPIQSHWHHRWALITLHCNEYVWRVLFEPLEVIHLNNQLSWTFTPSFYLISYLHSLCRTWWWYRSGKSKRVWHDRRRDVRCLRWYRDHESCK